MTAVDIEKPSPAQSQVERMSDAEFITPAVDIAEDAEAFLFSFDMPGVQSQDVDVHIENGSLLVEARPRSLGQDDRAYLLREHRPVGYRRSFTLNVPVAVDAIHAELKNGELLLRVPKAESLKARKIAVKTA